MNRAWISLFAIEVLAAQLSYAGAHPVRIDESSNCVECHADHTTGDHVHPALKNGCLSCHKVENHDDASFITVQRTESNDCQSCHKPTSVSHSHLPHASRMCTRCHDPHASKYPALLRAKVNDVCLDCHLESQAKHASRDVPTIELTADHHLGHPYARHP